MCRHSIVSRVVGRMPDSNPTRASYPTERSDQATTLARNNSLLARIPDAGNDPQNRDNSKFRPCVRGRGGSSPLRPPFKVRKVVWGLPPRTVSRLTTAEQGGVARARRNKNAPQGCESKRRFDEMAPCAQCTSVWERGERSC